MISPAENTSIPQLKQREAPVRARIFKRLRSPEIDSKEWIPPAYDSLAGRYDNPITLF